MFDGTGWIAIHWPQLMILIFVYGTAGQVTKCNLCIYKYMHKYFNVIYVFTNYADNFNDDQYTYLNLESINSSWIHQCSCEQDLRPRLELLGQQAAYNLEPGCHSQGVYCFIVQFNLFSRKRAPYGVCIHCHFVIAIS